MKKANRVVNDIHSLTASLDLDRARARKFLEHVLPAPDRRLLVDYLRGDKQIFDYEPSAVTRLFRRMALLLCIFDGDAVVAGKANSLDSAKNAVLAQSLYQLRGHSGDRVTNKVTRALTNENVSDTNAWLLGPTLINEFLTEGEFKKKYAKAGTR
jgi:hypothetical protein